MLDFRRIKGEQAREKISPIEENSRAQFLALRARKAKVFT
jgi:hypothetical protein